MKLRIHQDEDPCWCSRLCEFIENHLDRLANVLTRIAAFAILVLDHATKVLIQIVAFVILVFVLVQIIIWHFPH